MGAGKSATGSAVADLLGWSFFDNDRELEAFEGRTVVELAADGAESLHARESAQLHRAAMLPPPFVAGVAASVGDRPMDLDLLRDSGCVVYLRASVDVLVQRVGSGTDRPWLGGDPEVWITQQLIRREPYYLTAAPIVIDVDRLTAAEAGAVVIDRLFDAGHGVPQRDEQEGLA